MTLMSYQKSETALSLASNSKSFSLTLIRISNIYKRKLPRGAMKDENKIFILFEIAQHKSIPRKAI